MLFIRYRCTMKEIGGDSLLNPMIRLSVLCMLRLIITVYATRTILQNRKDGLLTGILRSLGVAQTVTYSKGNVTNSEALDLPETIVTRLCMFRFPQLTSIIPTDILLEVL